jgi:hypothetical protein
MPRPCIKRDPQLAEVTIGAAGPGLGAEELADQLSDGQEGGRVRESDRVKTGRRLPAHGAGGRQKGVGSGGERLPGLRGRDLSDRLSDRASHCGIAFSQ